MLRVAWLLVALMPTSAWAGNFRFQVPEGWTDLSPGAPPENIAKAPPQFIADGRAAGFVFLAADLAHADDGFLDNENVLVQRLGEPVSQAYVDGVMTEVQAEHARRSTPKFKVLEHGMTTIAEVAVGRIVSGFESDGIEIRQMAYLIPGGDSVAIMTFSTTAEAFPVYAPAQKGKGVGAVDDTRVEVLSPERLGSPESPRKRSIWRRAARQKLGL
jgi:hypothetical protein